MNFCNFRRLKSTKSTKFRAQKMAKAAFLVLYPPKLISRKIWMTEKGMNFQRCVNILIFAEMDLAISKEKKRNKWKVCNRPFARVKTRLSSSKNQDVHFKCITRSGLSVRCIVKIAITPPPPPLSPNSPITTNNFCFNPKNSHLIIDINVSVIAGKG